MESYFPAASGYSLFKNNLQASIGIHDTIQGSLGDCWLLAMIASIAEFPDRIFNMFDTKSYNGKGVYSIKLYEMGVPISLMISFQSIPLGELILTHGLTLTRNCGLFLLRKLSQS